MMALFAACVRRASPTTRSSRSVSDRRLRWYESRVATKTNMAAENVEARLSALEREMAQIKRLMGSKSIAAPQLWWERIAGAFEDDLLFEHAMKLGRQYRESLRPKRGERRGSKNARPRHRSS